MSPSKTIFSPDEVRELITSLVHPLGSETISVSECAGRVTAAAIFSPEDLPPFDRSAVDGYAVREDDQRNEFSLVARLAAGSWKPMTLGLGEAVQVGTGAALPSVGLRVFMKEVVTEKDGRIVIETKSSGDHIRRKGEDACAGSQLVPPGTLLRHWVIALLESIGAVDLPVRCLPRVVHYVTGDELVPPRGTPKPGQIRDANSGLVRDFLRAQGMAVEQKRIGEAEHLLRESLVSVGQPDLLLISGGASVGERDYTHDVLSSLGFVIHVTQTSGRPGKPLILASREKTIAVGLPGNPLSHYACLHLYVRRILDCFSGLPLSDSLPAGQLVGSEKRVYNPRETYWPAESFAHGHGIGLRLLSWRSSGDITSLSRADALARIPSRTEKICDGEIVHYLSTTFEQ